MVDDSLDPLSKEAADDASKQLISSQEGSRDDLNSLISPPGMFSCNSATVWCSTPFCYHNLWSFYIL